MAETTETKTLPEADKKKEQSLPFYQLFSFADKYDWLLMISGSIGAIIHGSSMPVFFLLFGEMVNGFGKNQMDLKKMTAEVAKRLHAGCTLGKRQVSTLRKKYLEAVLKQDVGFFDTDARTGDIVFSVSTDTLLVQDAISEKVGNFIHYLSTFLAGLVVGFVSAWRLALLSVAVIPGIAFAGGLYAYTLTGLTSKSRESYANAGIIAEQAIAQVRTVYSYVGESKALNSYSDAIQNTLQLGYKAGMAKGLGLGCTYGIACMSWALVFWYAGVFIRNGQTDGGKAFTAIFSAIVGGIPDVIIFGISQSSSQLERLVAVVGGSGSGKSTVVSLIERFYDPNQAGQVLIDSVDIRTLQLKWLRDQIGLVNQEPALFATTILENILYGKPDATMADVEAAASAANAHSFITLLPNGYNTQVGERGVQLSGGQKQRIAIARAMLKNPKILLLDEATSALDASSESIVQEALDRLMRLQESIYTLFRSSRLSHSLSTKSLSLRSGSLRNLSYQYSTGADGRIEMISNAETDRKTRAPDGYFFRLLKLNAPEWPYSIMGAIGSVLSGLLVQHLLL
ncbi:hypothetical protein GBA52_025875 [Prunus armeniaca]|nr:hypothetical protein GBA52_025875 [Prunus armeniaca]